MKLRQRKRNARRRRRAENSQRQINQTVISPHTSGLPNRAQCAARPEAYLLARLGAPRLCFAADAYKMDHGGAQRRAAVLLNATFCRNLAL